MLPVQHRVLGLNGMGWSNVYHSPTDQGQPATRKLTIERSAVLEVGFEDSKLFIANVRVAYKPGLVKPCPSSTDRTGWSQLPRVPKPLLLWK